MIALLAATALAACGPTRSVPNVPSRTVPYPLTRSGAELGDDSLVVENWTTRAEIPDPLAGAEAGPRIRVDATLYGEDVIDATLARECTVDSVVVDSCMRRARAAYDAQHLPDSLFRIRLNLRSTFSVNSLQPKFWDIYIKDERQIEHEPTRIDLHDPVIVREDSLPEPGRAAVRAGLYRRSIDLYFPIRTPFGVRTVGPDVSEIRLIISRERKEQANLVWRIAAEGAKASSARPKRRASAGRIDF